MSTICVDECQKRTIQNNDQNLSFVTEIISSGLVTIFEAF